MTVYLVGRWLDDGTLWGVQGIFSQNWRAVEACRDDACFLLPFELDQEAETLERQDRPASYPAREDLFAAQTNDQEAAA